MANVFELNININTIEKTETEQALEETQNGAATSSAGNSGNKGGSGAKGAVALAIGAKVLGDVKKEFMKTVSFQTSLMTTLYGDKARENEINNIMNTVNTGVGIIQTTAQYASMGAMAGPVGAVIGAAIGFVTSVSSEIYSMYQRGREWDIKYQNDLREENYAMERLGVLTASKGR